MALKMFCQGAKLGLFFVVKLRNLMPFDGYLIQTTNKLSVN